MSKLQTHHPLVRAIALATAHQMTTPFRPKPFTLEPMPAPLALPPPTPKHEPQPKLSWGGEPVKTTYTDAELKADKALLAELESPPATPPTEDITPLASAETDYSAMTKAELLALCERLSVTARKSWTKAQIINEMNARKAERAELLARASHA